MDIRQLKYFLVIADCGSLSQAAFKLHVVQSALSHNIAQLEEELDIKLFARHPRGVTLTKAGELLCGYASSILDTVAEAKAKVGAINSDLKEYVWIGLNHTVNQQLMPTLVKRLNKQFPGLKLGFLEDLSVTLIDYLIEGKIDIALAYNPLQDELLKTIPLFQERICCVGSSEFLGEQAEPIKFSEVLKLPMILAGQGENLRGIIADQKLRQELSKACVLEVNSLSALFGVLKEGIGCTALSNATISKYSGEEELVVRPIIEPEIIRELHIVYLKHTKNDSQLNKLADLMKALVLDSTIIASEHVKIID